MTLNPQDFATIFMLTAASMFTVGVVSGIVLGLFWRWFMQSPEQSPEKIDKAK